MQLRSCRARVLALLLAVLVLLPGCVQFNETAYELNRHLAVVAEPVVAILLIVPEPLMDRVQLFLRNLRYGDVVVNQFLQGKPQLALQDLGRWTVNSTAGIGGLFDVAKDLGLPAHQEDFGQTLAVWGFPQGRYLVLPVVGPTTDRDLVGFAIAFVTNPTFWVDEPLITTPITVLSYANQALEAREGLAQLAGEAADPYVFVREAYLQRRRYLIYDGQPPPIPGDMDAMDDLDLEGLEDFDEGLDEGLEEDETGTPVDTDAAPVETPAVETPGPDLDALPDLEDLDGKAADGVEALDDLPGLEEARAVVPRRRGGWVTGPEDLPGLVAARLPRGLCR